MKNFFQFKKTKSINLAVNGEPIAREELKAFLQGLSRQQKALFAIRLAIRLYPLLTMQLAKNGEWFGYWKKNNRAKYVSDIFRSKCFVINYLSGGGGAAYAAYDAAYAAYAAAAYDAAYAAYDAAAAAYAAAYDAAYAAYAAAAYAADAAYAAYAAYDAAAAAYAVDRDIYWKTLRYDLANINTISLNDELWQFGRPKAWDTYEANLKIALTEVGVPILYDDYQLVSNGDFDQDRITRYLNMPKEILERGIAEEIQDYLARDSDGILALSEARVIVLGDGDAGKTSLLSALLDNKFNKDSDPTPGVKVREEAIEINQQKINVHYWDFGGQPHLHPAHQYFLRSRCIYIIVFKLREAGGDGNNINLWLEHVRLFGGGAPVILVQNQVDRGGSMQSEPPFNLQRLKERYAEDCPNMLVGDKVFNLSCQNAVEINCEQWGLSAIETAIKDLIAQQKQDFTSEIVALKDALKKEQKSKDFIDRTRVLELAKEAGINVTDEASFTRAIELVNDLGLSFHFKSTGDKFFILNPNWLLQYVYALIWHSDKSAYQGVISIERIKEILKDKKDLEDKPLKIPDDDTLQTLLKILQEFDLIYSIGQGQYRAPMLTPVQSPPFPAQKGEQLTQSLKMKHGEVPSSLYYRLVNQTGRAGEILGDKMWRFESWLRCGGVVGRLILDSGAITIILYGESDALADYATSIRHRFYDLVRARDGEKSVYDELDFTPQISLANSTKPFNNINLDDALSALNKGKLEIAQGDSNGRWYALSDFIRTLFGQGLTPEIFAREIEVLFAKMKDANRNEINAVKASLFEQGFGKLNGFNIAVTSHNAINNQVTQTVTIINQFQKLNKVFDNIEFELDEADISPEKKDEAIKAIAFAKKKMAEYEAVKDQEGKETEEEKKSALSFLKKATEKVGKALDGVSNLAALAEKATNVMNAIEPFISNLM